MGKAKGKEIFHFPSISALTAVTIADLFQVVAFVCRGVTTRGDFSGSPVYKCMSNYILVTLQDCQNSQYVCDFL